MREYYYELVVTPSSHKEEIESFLMDHFYNGIEERSDSLILRSDEPLDDIVEKLEEYRKNLSQLWQEDIEIAIEQHKKPNIDWIEKYKKSITPVEVGEFYIYPSWYEPKKEKINIQIDPALAFGSGHHETTRGCLQAISKYIQRGDKVLDVGTGSGVLAIAAYKKGAVVDICDTDELAIEEAKKNFSLNEAKFNEAWVGSAANAKKKYDIVLANIVADVLVMIGSDIIRATKSGGFIILSGIIQKYRDKVLKKFDLPIQEIIEDGEWITIILKNRGDNGR